MKWIKVFVIGLVLIGAVDSCVKEPSYSIIPHIELQDLYYKKGPSLDTLIFKVKFTDGDGDLGIGQEDSINPYFYNPWYWAYNPSDFSELIYLDNTATLQSGYTWLNYKARKLTQFDTLPGFNCENWQPLYDNSTQPKVIDTIYISQNLRAYNFTVDVSIKNNTGTYDKFKPGDYIPFPNCNPNLFRATFPDLSNDRRNSPLDGTITFRIQSYGLKLFLSTKTLKMDIYINDRAYHQSNVVEKKGFTLQQITR
jgi:hypothetical protein